ncbi:MAG: hypothetical protein LUD12_10810 [Lachnospiraceae bacterium]|nr:hypothetical protein [Lachnospiraceae bacterium]
MYKKKSKKPIYIAAAAVILLVVLLVIVQSGLSRQIGQKKTMETETESEKAAETETDVPSHNILLYKSSSGTIEFDAGWLVSDNDSDSVLQVEENILVTMLITPSEGKALESVDVLDYDMQTVSSVVRSVSGTEDASGQMRLSFVMPDRDIFGKGYTGSITGTMSSYEISPENQTATIRIMLSTGGTITGTYNKSANTYSFSGL